MRNALLDARTAGGVCLALAVLSAGLAWAADPVAVSSAAGTIVRESGRRLLSMTGADAGAAVALPDRLVVAGTDTVRVDGELLERGTDYTLSADESRLLFAEAPSGSSAVTISYLYLPFELQEFYRHAVLESLTGLPPWIEGEGRLVETSQRDERDLPSDLRVAGAKTFGISVGSDRDPTLEQSLRLSVNGRITRDLKVNAYLSDQNTPLVPEGDTEELRALDRVLLELEGENVSARMGDVELSMRGGSLFDVRRELKGATAEGTFGPVGLSVAGAAADGEFSSHTFRGVDGKQGPYLLVGQSGQTGIQVVAGSENVWIDGQRVRRGRDNDYVIDYASGELTFTERRSVTSDNVITVDYEYSLAEYERDIYGARGTIEVGELGLVGLSFFRESDDRGSPISTVIGDEQEAILRAAGDDTELAHDDGVDSVGVGGDYVMTAGGYFEYAGADSGEYDLHFERSEAGDYDYDFESDHYVYAGEGAGEYVLGRSLPLPSDHSLGALDAAVELAGDGSIELEAAVSSLDMNTFSEIGDGDNLGNAEVVRARLPRLRFSEADGGSVGLDVRARRVAGNFAGVGRYRDVRYLEGWELRGLTLPAQERMFEGAATAEHEGLGRLEVSYGHLERGDAATSRKAEFSLDGRPFRGTRLKADGRLVELDALEEDRGREFLRTSLEQEVGPVAPGVDYRHDSRTSGDAAGERYDEYGASLRRAGGEAFGFGVRYAHRLTDRRDEEGWKHASTTRTQEYSLVLRGTELLSLEATASRRVTNFEPGFDDPGTKHDVASAWINHRSMGGALKGELRYAVTSTEVEERRRQIAVEDGVETIRVLSTGNYYPVTELSASTRWEWGSRYGGSRGRELPDPSPLRRFLSTLSFETDLRLSEVTTTRQKWRLYALDPAVVRGEDTVRGEITGRHVARYVARDGTRSLRLAVTTRDALDRSYLDSADRKRDRAGTIDLKLSPSGAVRYRLQGDIGRRVQSSVGTGYSYEIDERAALLELTIRRLGDLEASLAVRASEAEEHLEDISLLEVTVTPSAKYRLRSKGTITASVSRIDLTADVERLPVYLASGRRTGLSTEWRIAGDYRLNRVLTASVSYVGDNRPDAETRHTFDMRVNAYF